MGFESEALIGVQVDPDKVDQVADGLDELDEVRWVAVTTGTYDVFAWATLMSAEALGIFLRTKVGTIKGVRRTETFVNLEKRRGLRNSDLGLRIILIAENGAHIRTPAPNGASYSAVSRCAVLHFARSARGKISMRLTLMASL